MPTEIESRNGRERSRRCESTCRDLLSARQGSSSERGLLKGPERVGAAPMWRLDRRGEHPALSSCFRPCPLKLLSLLGSDQLQYFGIDGSTSSLHRRIPPATLVARKPAALS